MHKLLITVIIFAFSIGTSMSVTVGFSATINHGRRAEIGERIIFDNVLTNVGNAYSPNTGAFTCPVTGLYSFNVAFLCRPGVSLTVDLYHEKKYLITLHVDDPVVYASGSRTVLVQCYQGQKVFVENRRSTVLYSGNDTPNYLHNIFSGFLIGATVG